jgi:hypothetical protein
METGGSRLLVYQAGPGNLLVACSDPRGLSTKPGLPGMGSAPDANFYTPLDETSAHFQLGELPNHASSKTS